MSVRSEVEQLMRLDTRYRDSDKELTLKVWEMEGFQLTKAQKFMFMGLPSAEVITRRRREFSLKYPASAKVMEHRYRQFKEMREEFGKVKYPGIKKIERVPFWSRFRKAK